MSDSASVRSYFTSKIFTTKAQYYSFIFSFAINEHGCRKHGNDLLPPKHQVPPEAELTAIFNQETAAMTSMPDHYPADAPATEPYRDPQPQSGFLRKLEDLPSEGGTDPVYGDVTWRTLISADRTASCDFLLGVAEFQANGTLHLHRHVPPEFYLCLSGSGMVSIDGVQHAISAGTAVFIPGNAEHGVIAGPDGLSFAYGFARNVFSDIEYVFSERSNVVPLNAGDAV